MEQIIKDILTTLENNSYEAYIVGGFVRDEIMHKTSYDIDIATNARPKDIVNLFSSYDVKLYEYGNVSFSKDNYNFDITTFRKDIKYSKNRKPEKIVYIDLLEEDLKRRDFTINAICKDKDSNIIDYYDGKKDIKRKIIRSIGDPNKKLEEDALRILRAIRFATSFRFKIDPSLEKAIKNNKHLLKNLSYERKMAELNKIFTSKHKKYGVKLLEKYNLLEDLELKNIRNVLLTNDKIGMWSTITDAPYPFTKQEKDLIKQINNLLNEDINDVFIQYKYGLYPLTIVSDLKKLNTKKIIDNYERLPIKGKEELKITTEEICEVLNKKPGNFIKDVYENLEKRILLKKLENNKEKIIEYIKNNF